MRQRNSGAGSDLPPAWWDGIDWQACWFLGHAMAAGFALALLPLGLPITYPVRLYHTFIHETGHALATVASGGAVLDMQIRTDASGVTYTRGAVEPLVSMAGYLGTVIFGTILVAVGRHRLLIRPALLICAALTAWAALWFPRLTAASTESFNSAFACIFGLGAAAVVVILGSRASDGAARFALTLLAVLFCALSLSDMVAICIEPERVSDLQTVAAATGTRAGIWASLWTSFAGAGTSVAVWRPSVEIPAAHPARPQPLACLGGLWGRSRHRILSESDMQPSTALKAQL